MVKTVDNLNVSELEDGQKGTPPLLSGKLDIVKNVKVKLEVRIGEAELTVDELMGLSKGAVVALTKSLNSPIELLLDGNLIAYGTLVAADESFGIQITELGGE